MKREENIARNFLRASFTTSRRLASQAWATDEGTSASNSDRAIFVSFSARIEWKKFFFL